MKTQATHVNTCVCLKPVNGKLVLQYSDGELSKAKHWVKRIDFTPDSEVELQEDGGILLSWVSVRYEVER